MSLSIPTRAWRYDSGCVVGVDLGASHWHAMLADCRGKVLSEVRESLRPEDGPRRMIAQMTAGIRRLASSSGKRLRGLAVGVPSAVVPTSGRVTFANNLPGWKNVRLREALEREFRVPVWVENDVNLAALGEHWRGVAQGARNFVFVALGTGIGAGVFIDGKLHRGRTGSAGEIYRLNLEWPRWNHDFGDTGYFEAVVSGLGIAALGRERLKSRSAGAAAGLAGERDARFVFDSFRRGNARARAVLENVFTVLGVGLANLVAVLDPELIVLGGGVAQGAPEFMLRIVRKVVRRIQPDPPPVKLSALGENAQALGAVCAALEAARLPLRRLGTD